jgi:hypothetical protein
VLILSMLFGVFRLPSPRTEFFLPYALDGHGYIFSWTCNHLPPRLCNVFEPGMDRVNEVELPFVPPAFELFSRAPRGHRGGSARCGLWWLKGRQQHGLGYAPLGSFDSAPPKLFTR